MGQKLGALMQCKRVANSQTAMEQNIGRDCSKQSASASPGNSWVKQRNCMQSVAVAASAARTFAAARRLALRRAAPCALPSRPRAAAALQLTAPRRHPHSCQHCLRLTRRFALRLTQSRSVWRCRQMHQTRTAMPAREAGACASVRPAQPASARAPAHAPSHGGQSNCPRHDVGRA